MKKLFPLLALSALSIQSSLACCQNLDTDMYSADSLFSVIAPTDNLRTEYRHGSQWLFYTNSNVTIRAKCTVVRDYGRYFRVPLIIENNSAIPFDFNPDNILANIIDMEGERIVLPVLSSNEYMRKVKRSQNWAMALNGFSAGMAGYSTSTTTTSAYSPKIGHVSAVSTTTTYNATAAAIAIQQNAEYNRLALEERAIKEEGYLKITTIYPGEIISGYVHIKKLKGQQLNVLVAINGIGYEFSWDASQ
jgi:hypothetical protein